MPAWISRSSTSPTSGVARSAEVEFGTEWKDSSDSRYELSWVQDTGELYIMRELLPPAFEDPLGDIVVQQTSNHDDTVVVIGHIEQLERVEEVLGGWQAAMAQPRGVEWVVDRLRSSGVAFGPPPV